MPLIWAYARFPVHLLSLAILYYFLRFIVHKWTVAKFMVLNQLALLGSPRSDAKLQGIVVICGGRYASPCSSTFRKLI